jgi:hypothetical protein
MTKKKQDVINDVEDSKISPKEVYENYVKPLGMPKVYPDAAPTLPPAPIPGLTIGRRVHYALDRFAGEHRAADITNVINPIDGIVNLLVHFDGTTDGHAPNDCTYWVQGVEYSEFALPGTWHFIEKA